MSASRSGDGRKRDDRRDGGPPARAAVIYDCLFPYESGGGERVYGRIAELLTERGIRVDYVTRVQWPADDPPRRPYRVAGIGSAALYDDAGVRTASGALAFARAVLRFLLRRRRDYGLVVVSALPVLTALAAAVALAGSRTRVVVDWLEVWPWRRWRDYSGTLTGTIAWTLQFLALRVGWLHTVNSDFTAGRVRRYRPRTDPLVLGLFDLAPDVPNATPERTGADRALSVGRHIADKRVRLLPEVGRLLADARPGSRMTVAGSGPETQAVREEVRSRGLGGIVAVPGRVSEARLQQLLGEASVLVHPSAREGFGLVVAEAAAHATPSVVVAGEGNAAAELVEEGVNGAVALDARPETIAAAVVRVLNGGEGLRRSTLAWFRRERGRRNLSSSVDEILRRYRESAR